MTVPASKTNPARRSSRRVLSYVTITDFSKGIDARRDKTAVKLGYAIAARNVTWFEQGGVYCRRGVGPITYGRGSSEMNEPPADPVSYYNYRRGSQTLSTYLSQHLIACDNDRLYAGAHYVGPVTLAAGPGPHTQPPENGTWQQLASGATPVVRVGRPGYAEWDNYVYISLGNEETGDTNPMIRWDGDNVFVLGNAWSEDIANPTTGNMPRARHIATLSNRMFVAFLGGNPAKPNRVHFSHPFQAEAWRVDDWIDVGASGDEITGIAPVRDMLVVFKRNSTYAIIGNSPENFRAIQVVDGIGCDGHWDFGPNGAVVFWDPEVGVCQFDGKAVETLFTPLQPLIQDGSIRACKGIVAAADHIYAATDYSGFTADVKPGQPTAALHDWDRLSADGVTWDGLSVQNLTWDAFTTVTYDMIWVRPSKGGWTSWTLLQPEIATITHLGRRRNFVPLDGDTPGTAQVVVCFDFNCKLVYLDRFSDGYDHFGYPGGQGPVVTPIKAWYLTAWLHGGLPAQIKRWKSHRVIQGAHDDGKLTLGVYYDFDPWELRRDLNVETTEPEPPFTYDISKPGTIGRAKAIQLRISSPEARQWSVHSITIPLYPKVLR